MKIAISLMLLLMFQLAFAQREYTFNYHSRYEAGLKSETKPLQDVSVYDNSADTSYQMMVYPESARVRDEGRGEMHYYRLIKEADSVRYVYDYSLRVSPAPDFEISAVKVNKINDLDYEITYQKKSQRMQTREKMEICLQEYEDDLLNTVYTDMSKREVATFMKSLRASTGSGKKYYIAGLVHTTGRYRFQYDRREVAPVILRVSLPAQVLYKNSFLKN